MSITRIGVIYGGRSTEYEVSAQSANTVLQHLDRKRFSAIPIHIDLQGQWWIYDVNHLPQVTPSQLMQALEIPYRPSSLPVDVIFSVCHGALGEDGAMQGLLSVLDIPYVGAGVLGSALAMNKVFAKRLVASQGIAVGPYLDFNQVQWQARPAYYRQQIASVGYPVFIKPVNTGSSIGISRVETPQDLTKAIEEALRYDRQILVEKALQAREIEIAVLENREDGDFPRVSIPGEIILNTRHSFYSYEAKYKDPQGAQLQIPVILPQGVKNQLQALAARIFVRLNCEGMARIDFFLERDTQQLYFNEINTLPGFTQISMYPKLWEASGIPLPQLLTELIDLALLRHTRSAVYRAPANINKLYVKDKSL